MVIYQPLLLNLFQSNDIYTFDAVRRKYIFRLHKSHQAQCHSLCNTMAAENFPLSATAIVDEDIQPPMEASYGLYSAYLDLFLHSPGDSPEAAEVVVLYLRLRFSHILVIVPQLAMLATTMIACDDNETVLGEH